MAPLRVPDEASLTVRLAQLRCPGLSLVEIDGLQVGRQWHLGLADPISGRPITAQTIFQAASISKPVFALAVMQLVEQRLLRLDEDVTSYLKTWSLPAGSHPVTLRQLLNHSSGATVDGFPGYEPGEALPTIDQILDGAPPANTPAVRIVGRPGAAYAYSGGGITLAQKVFEDATGATFATWMEQNVLGPLGMLDSCFEQPLGELRSAGAANGHVQGLALPGSWNTYPELAAAGLWTSARDLAKLGIAVMRRYAGLDSALGLGQATVTEMLKPKLEEQGPDKISVGIGWFCVGKGLDLTFGHNGGNTGYVAQICLRPSDGSGLVFFSNGSEAYPLLAEIMGKNRFSASL